MLFEGQKNPLDRVQTNISVHSNILGFHSYAKMNDNPVDYLRDCFSVRYSDDGKRLKQCEVDSEFPHLETPCFSQICIMNSNDKSHPL